MNLHIRGGARAVHTLKCTPSFSVQIKYQKAKINKSIKTTTINTLYIRFQKILIQSGFFKTAEWLRRQRNRETFNQMFLKYVFRAETEKSLRKLGNDVISTKAFQYLIFNGNQHIQFAANHTHIHIECDKQVTEMIW